MSYRVTSSGVRTIDYAPATRDGRIQYDGLISWPGRLDLEKVLGLYLESLPRPPTVVPLTARQRKQIGPRFCWRGHLIETAEYDPLQECIEETEEEQSPCIA